MRGRIQAADAAFGLKPSAPFTLHKEGVATTIGGQAAVPVFDDTKTYWFAGDGHSAASHGRHQVSWLSVDPPDTGTKIRVKSTNEKDLFMHIEVNPN